jgi:hypothetical protein
MGRTPTKVKDVDGRHRWPVGRCVSGIRRVGRAGLFDLFEVFPDLALVQYSNRSIAQDTPHATVRGASTTRFHSPRQIPHSRN